MRYTVSKNLPNKTLPSDRGKGKFTVEMSSVGRQPLNQVAKVIITIPRRAETTATWQIQQRHLGVTRVSLLPKTPDLNLVTLA
jgi:hypothetical protein